MRSVLARSLSLSIFITGLVIGASALADEPVHFFGKVGFSLVSGDLTRDGKTCTGKIHYKQMEDEMSLRGKKVRGKWTFVQRDPMSKRVGTFEGSWDDGERVIHGTWESPDKKQKKQKFSFTLEPPKWVERWERIEGPIEFNISWEYTKHLLTFSLSRDGQTAFRPKTRGKYDRLANEFAGLPLTDGPTIVTVSRTEKLDDLFKTLDWENKDGNWQPAGTATPSKKVSVSGTIDAWIGARTAKPDLAAGRPTGTETREAVLMDPGSKTGVTVLSSTLTEDEFTELVESFTFRRAGTVVRTQKPVQAPTPIPVSVPSSSDN